MKEFFEIFGLIDYPECAIMYFFRFGNRRFFYIMFREEEHNSWGGVEKGGHTFRSINLILFQVGFLDVLKDV